MRPVYERDIVRMSYSASTLLQAAFWVGIVILAFFMQAVPLLLILTLFNMAIGISSTVALVLIPVLLFATLTVACMLAEQQRSKMRPLPVAPDARRAPPETALRDTAPCLLPYMRRQRFF